MQTVSSFKSLIFIGTVRELRLYLRTLPKKMTLRHFLWQQIH